MTDLQALENELMHARVYDPAKAHAYYISRRNLKGRRRAGVDISSSRSGDHGDQGGTGGSSNAVLRDSRSKKLEADVEELRKKVERVKELIRLRVGEAKKRAGVDEPAAKESSSSSTKGGKTAASKDSKAKPLTEKQKADKREASKEQYDKEKGTSLAREAEALRNTLQNLRERLEKLPKPANQGQPPGGRFDQKDGGNGR